MSSTDPARGVLPVFNNEGREGVGVGEEWWGLRYACLTWPWQLS